MKVICDTVKLFQYVFEYISIVRCNRSWNVIKIFSVHSNWTPLVCVMSVEHGINCNLPLIVVDRRNTSEIHLKNTFFSFNNRALFEILNERIKTYKKKKMLTTRNVEHNRPRKYNKRFRMRKKTYNKDNTNKRNRRKSQTFTSDTPGTRLRIVRKTKYKEIINAEGLRFVSPFTPI